MNYCVKNKYLIENSTALFSEILEELEKSYEKKFGTIIDLKSAFQKNRSYVFDIVEPENHEEQEKYDFDIVELENHEDEEQKSYEEQQKGKLFDILKGWKDNRWNFKYLMNLKSYLIDLVRRYDQKNGKLIAISEEEISKRGTMIDDAIDSLIYLAISCSGDKKIIYTMGTELKKLQDKCLKLDVKKDYIYIIDFLKEFYNFVSRYDERLSPGFIQNNRNLQNMLFAYASGNVKKNQGSMGIDFVEKHKRSQEINKILAETRKINRELNLRNMNIKELLEMQYHILGELSSRIFSPN